MSRKYDLTTAELKEQIKKAGLKVQPSWKHEDYVTPSFSIPYPLYDKMYEMVRHIGCSRSAFIQALITRAYERYERGESAFGT